MDTVGARGKTIRCSAVVCAHNEEQNLPGLIRTLLEYRHPAHQIDEVICVASGCTDRTVDVLTDARSADSRVHVIIQPLREGKASALMVGLRAAQQEVVLVENADTLPGPGALDELLAPFDDPQVVLVTCRPVPVGIPRNFAERLGITLWSFHDAVAQGRPKAGEAFAIRRVPLDVPPDIEDDDTFVQAFMESYGGRTVYARSAVVFNRVPASIWDLARQRYRINRQLVGLYRRHGVGSSSWSPRDLLASSARFLRDHPHDGPRLVALAGFETGIRLAAVTSRIVDARPIRSWSPIGSTKAPIADSDAGSPPNSVPWVARR